MTLLCPDRLWYNLIVPAENQNTGDIILPVPPYGARWNHVFCWTYTPTHSVRIIRDVLDKMRYGQRDETSNIRNMFGGLSFDDQPREVLAEALKNTMKIADLLYEMSLRTPEQHHLQERSVNRRRRQRVDDGDDTSSFSTPGWRQTMTTQSPTTPVWPHISHGEGPSHSMTTQSLTDLARPSTSHGYGHSQSMTTQSPMTLAWTSTLHGTSNTSHDFQTPQQTYARRFTELLLDEHHHHNEESRPNYNISPITYMGYFFPQSSSYVPPNVNLNVGVDEGQEEEVEVDAQPLVRKRKRVPKAHDCGTGHHLYRK